MLFCGFRPILETFDFQIKLLLRFVYKEAKDNEYLL
jgi:hypothetical protein